MKWPPNKKLHLEDGIIKAIQILNQATLDEVIEKLGELRDGSPRDEPVRSAQKSSPAEKKTLSAENPSGESHGRSTGTMPAPPAEELPVAEPPNGEMDPQKIWQGVFAKIPNTKAFVRNSAAAAHVLPSEGRHFVLGFSTDQKSPMEFLGTDANRKFIESLLHEVSGKDWTLKLTVQENLPPKGETSSSSKTENYGGDPLIREAVEIFKGEVRR